MSINAGTVYVDVRPDMTGFGSAISSGVGTGMSTATRSSKVRSGIARFGRSLAIPIAGAVALGLGAAVEAASNMEETMSKVGVVFGKSSRDVAKWASEAVNSMGMSKQAAMANAAQFKSMLDSMGLANDVAEEMSLKYVQLESDLASFHNLDPAQAHDAIAQAIAGEFEGLKRLGVVLNETIIKERAMKMGLVKEGQELDQTSKELAVYDLVMEKTKDAHGDFARTSDSVANRQRKVQAQLSNTAAKLGKVLLPVVADALDWFAKLVKMLTKDLPRGWEIMAKTATRWWGNFANGLETVRNNIVAVLNGIIIAWNNTVGALFHGQTVNIPGFLPGPDSFVMPDLTAGTMGYSNEYGAGHVFSSDKGGDTTKDEALSRQQAPIVVEDHTTDGVTVRQRHSDRMKRSQRPGGDD